jgi:spermidine synthase
VQPSSRHYGAVFVLSLCLLMLEIAVARILSVALLSHYAFVAVSLAMFGLGLSGLVVYLLPGTFRPDRVDAQLTTFSWLFGLTAAVSMAIFLHTQVVQEISLRGLLTLAFAYTVLAVPFFLGGVCISIAMTHFSAAIGRIYAADLLGASLGCLTVVALLQRLPAPSVVLVVAGLSGALALALAARPGGRARLSSTVAGCLAIAGLIVAVPAAQLYRLTYVKNWNIPYAEYEAWNAFSRVGAFLYGGNGAQTLPLPQTASAYNGSDYPAVMQLDIDGTAWTPIIRFDGNLEALGFLRDSVIYAVHHLRPGASVLIIGIGGGRDVLAARVFGQPSVLGIELNPLMRHVVDERYADFSGQPYSRLGATVILDEARSRLAAIDQRFDIIQLSLIDTFSLNAAGSFVFSENFLYTQEAFEEYFRHLTDQGILSVTRYFTQRYPMEILRLLGMIRAAWADQGVTDIARHVVVVAQQFNATVLAKRSPFTAEELDHLATLAAANHMRILYQPGGGPGAHPEITELITTPDPRRFIEQYEFLIHPATDDRPFFFHFLPGRLAEFPALREDPLQVLRQWSEAVSLMYLLILVVSGLAALFFFGPLLLLGRGGFAAVSPRVAAPLLLYFACLGYGFIMIEIPLMQRLILFLGYPVYALAVVLFALLLFSGLGSLSTSRFTARADRALPAVLGGIIGLALLYVYGLPPVLAALMRLPIEAKIATAIALLAPLGLVLGMAYPLGITILRRFGDRLVPWAWGLNGALSVVGSVLAIFISSRVGLTAALLTGVGAYAVALLCMTAVRTARP